MNFSELKNLARQLIQHIETREIYIDLAEKDYLKDHSFKKVIETLDGDINHCLSDLIGIQAEF